MVKFHLRDSAAKLIFGNNELFSQFLKGYLDLPQLKSINPSNIEDVSTRYVSVEVGDRDTDVVKRIRMPGIGSTDMIILGLNEQQSNVNHVMSLRMLRYIANIYTKYEEDCEKTRKNSTTQIDFRLPFVLPVVFFNGSGAWTAVENFRDKVDPLAHTENFLPYIPDFRYKVVALPGYSDADLLQRGDALSLIFRIDKARGVESFRKIEEDYRPLFSRIQATTSEAALRVIKLVAGKFLLKIDVPEERAEQFVDQIYHKELIDMFANVEPYSWQETRKEAQKETRKETTIDIFETLYLDGKLNRVDALKYLQERFPIEEAECLLASWDAKKNDKAPSPKAPQQ